jgi:hypothetical protein
MHRAAWFAAAAAISWAVAASAEPASTDGDLYVINASGRPAEVVLDNAPLANLPRLGSVRHAVLAGPHGLAVVVDGRVASVWQEIGADNVALNPKGRPAWCYMAARGAKGVNLELMAPDQCRQIIAAGPAEAIAGDPPPRGAGDR